MTSFKMPCLKNAKLTKCYISKKMSLKNVNLSTCQADRISRWQNVKLTKMPIWHNAMISKWYVDKMLEKDVCTKFSIFKTKCQFAKWKFVKMPIWQKAMLTKWRSTINAGVFVSTLHNPNHIRTFIYFKKNVKKLNHRQHCKNIIFIENNSGKQKQYYLC